MSTLNTTNLKNPSSGSNNIVLATDGSTTITTLNSTTITGTSVRGVITSGTAVASTSGTAIDFTEIPSWVKRITVMLNGVSTNGTSAPQIQLGTSSGIDATGYLGSNALSVNASSTAAALFTTGFGIGVNTTNWGAAFIASGAVVISSMGSNTWTAQGTVGTSDGARIYTTAGVKTLSGTLDRIRITTANGTDAFDAGTINILYEG